MQVTQDKNKSFMDCDGTWMMVIKLEQTKHSKAFQCDDHGGDQQAKLLTSMTGEGLLPQSSP